MDPSKPKPVPRWTTWLFRRFLIVLGALVLLFTVYTWFVLTWSYAEGERSGWVQKFSKKGWLVKTWEGELALVTMPGAIPEKFYFTVRDDSVAARVNAIMGKRVVLHYRQHVGVPTTMFGETGYFVDDVKLVE